MSDALLPDACFRKRSQLAEGLVYTWRKARPGFCDSDGAVVQAEARNRNVRRELLGSRGSRDRNDFVALFRVREFLTREKCELSYRLPQFQMECCVVVRNVKYRVISARNQQRRFSSY